MDPDRKDVRRQSHVRSGGLQKGDEDGSYEDSDEDYSDDSDGSD